MRLCDWADNPRPSCHPFSSPGFSVLRHNRPSIQHAPINNTSAFAIDGKLVDFEPKAVYNGPYPQGDFRETTVAIRKEAEVLTFDIEREQDKTPYEPLGKWHLTGYRHHQRHTQL